MTQSFWRVSGSGKLTHFYELLERGVGVLGQIGERKIFDRLILLEMAGDLGAAEGYQVRVLRKDDVDLLGMEHVGQLGVGLVGRHDKWNVFEDQEI